MRSRRSFRTSNGCQWSHEVVWKVRLRSRFQRTLPQSIQAEGAQDEDKKTGVRERASASERCFQKKTQREDIGMRNWRSGEARARLEEEEEE
jgi:hypothetical protein